MIARISAIILGLCLCGCASFSKPEPEPIPQYRVATEQLPPEPVYGRVKIEYMPYTKPARETKRAAAPVVMPELHLSVENSSLEEVASILASSARYSSFVAYELADRRLTMDAIGSLDDLAKRISRRANVDVQVDHKRHLVRILVPGTKARTY